MIWRSAVADRFAQAGTIASAAIPVHSLVDYPLRTAALSAIFAGCLALMTQPRVRLSVADLWPTAPRGLAERAQSTIISLVIPNMV